ncbi:PAQR family membrane homeostasis protein TrhA [Desertimonas flava]|uniref:PAQR family membrane homeostasis protein TrhA n=1 Tax=Desertimonas flava TaxID=2064846 RepID=UPI000E34F56E|nr:hemolysin III family protein [Desertimonas flava]
MSTRAPVLALMDVPLGSATRPLWRGRLHLFGLVAAVPLLVVLAILAGGARARGGVIVYAVGLCAMLAVSVTYHRWVHTVRARAGWRRADHATIYAAIGGTFTPLTLMAFGTSVSVVMLIIVWGAAATGAGLKIVDWRHADRVGVFLYLGIGWAGVLLVPALWQQGGVACVALVSAGGVAYTVGAIGFGRRWPTLGPSVFSYHEVWHVFTLLAAGSHLGAVWIVAT